MSDVRFIAFDQRTENIGAATESGFLIFDAVSGRVTHEATFPKGGANLIALLSDSNIVAATGDGTPNGFYDNTVIIWDKNAGSVVSLYNFDDPILQLTFISDCLLVVRESVVSFCSLTDPKPLFEISIFRGHPRAVSIVQSVSACLACLPDKNGNALNIVDYRDPTYVLGRVPVQCSRVCATAFTRQGHMLAVVVDEGKLVLLYSLVPEIELVTRFRRGLRSKEVTGLGFDSLGKMMLMTTTRGSVHVFAVPTPTERASLNPTNTFRSKITYECEMKAQFDYAGFEVVGVTATGELQKLRLDMQSMVAVPLDPITLFTDE